MPKFIGTEKRWSNKHQWSWLQWTRAKIPLLYKAGSSRVGYRALDQLSGCLFQRLLQVPLLGKKARPNKKNASEQPNKVKAFYILASASYRPALPCHYSIELWLELLSPLCMRLHGFLLVCCDGESHCHTLTFHCGIKRWYRGPASMRPYSQVWHHVCGTDGQVGSLLYHRVGQHLTSVWILNKKSIILSH